MGYFKVKPVCLIYNWKDIEVDYQRCNKEEEIKLLAHREQRAILYVDEKQLFKDAIILLKSNHMASQVAVAVTKQARQN